MRKALGDGDRQVALPTPCQGIAFSWTGDIVLGSQKGGAHRRKRKGNSVAAQLGRDAALLGDCGADPGLSDEDAEAVQAALEAFLADRLSGGHLN
jgi:hypothetical protein